MNYRVKLILLLSCVSLLLSPDTPAQLLQGQWRDHLSHYSAHRMADNGTIIYCATELGMVSFNRATDELNKHSKVTGLSDVGISTLEYDSQTSKILIAYKNGNIDLILPEGKIANFPDIERKSITGSKSINRIFFHESQAFLACGFGIVVFDMNNHEIVDTYIFGDGGTPIFVEDISVADNFVYAATESGMFRADLNSPNLVDFQYWERLMFIPQPTSAYTEVELFNSELLCAYSDETLEADQIIRISGDSYTEWNHSYNEEVVDIYYANNRLGISSTDRVQVFSSDENLLNDFTAYGIRQAAVDENGQLYLATIGSGFVRYDPEGWKYLIPNGPRFNEVSQVATLGDNVWVSSGGPDRIYTHGAAYNLENGKWNSYTSGNIPSVNSLGNTYKFAIDPRDPKHVYAGTQQYGILEFLDGEVVKIHDRNNTDVFSGIADVVGVRVAGMDFDRNNNLWVVLDYVQQALFMLNAEGEWTNPRVTSTLLISGDTKFTDLIVASNGQIWISTLTNGLIVLEPDREGGFTEKSFSVKNSNDILTRSYCLDEDKDGNILVGTNAGPIKYYSPSSVFRQPDVIGVQEKIPRNDGTNQADFVLASDVILDIVVDGGNRIWCATDNSGVFLLDSDAKTTLENFRMENSKILSNNVSGIGINEVSGEVFFATSGGLVSYMGTATEGFADYSDVYVYPNPIRPEYEGIITITGLVENTIVKITDLSGNLVWETNSLGGQAIWDGRNFDGRKVASGIYLVMLAVPDGTLSHVTKLLFLN